MNCSETKERLSSYFDGELASDCHDAVSEHLATCDQCARSLAEFSQLSRFASELNTPETPPQLWSQIERQLEQESKTPESGEPVSGEEDLVSTSATQRASWGLKDARLIAFAASVLVAVGVGWFSYFFLTRDGDHERFEAQFGHYLELFQEDPNAAQVALFSLVESKPMVPEEAIHLVGYRPAIADGLPDGYTIESTHLMKTHCCTCTHSFCTRPDGTKLVVFEHDDDGCADEHCCIINLDHQIATSWKRGDRHITLVGVRDFSEVDQIEEWMNRSLVDSDSRAIGQ